MYLNNFPIPINDVAYFQNNLLRFRIISQIYNAYFKIMRKIGSGSWNQIGYSLDMVNLYPESVNSPGTRKFNAYGGLEWPDTGATGSGTVYYSVYARYAETGNDSISSNAFTILKGSSITAMEY